MTGGSANSLNNILFDSIDSFENIRISFDLQVTGGSRGEGASFALMSSNSSILDHSASSEGVFGFSFDTNRNEGENNNNHVQAIANSFHIIESRPPLNFYYSNSDSWNGFDIVLTNASSGYVLFSLNITDRFGNDFHIFNGVFQGISYDSYWPVFAAETGGSVSLIQFRDIQIEYDFNIPEPSAALLALGSIFCVIAIRN
jgi:hypothetical protein